MKLAINDEQLAVVLHHLDEAHKTQVERATSWSFDLNGDYDKYVEERKKELELAEAIHVLKAQKFVRAQNPAEFAEEPLADWEIALLTGQPDPGVQV